MADDPKSQDQQHNRDEATTLSSEEAARALPGETPQARDDPDPTPGDLPSYTPIAQTDNEQD